MIISFNEPQRALAKCSFCGLQEQHCKTLVQSVIDPRHHICGVCVEKATLRMASVPDALEAL